MDAYFATQSLVLLVLQLTVLAVVIFAFVNSLLWSAPSYEAAGKLTKATWVGILAVGLAVQLLAVPLLGVVALIAALVYLLDVRPALAGLHRR